MARFKGLFLASLLVLSCFGSLFISSSVNAYEISSNVEFVVSEYNPQLQLISSNGSCAWQQNSDNVVGASNSTPCAIKNLSLPVSNWGLSSGQIIQIQFYATNFLADNQSDSYFGKITATANSNSLGVVSVNASNVTGSGGIYTILLSVPRSMGGITKINLSATNPQSIFILNLNEVLTIGSISVFNVKNTNVNVEVPAGDNSSDAVYQTAEVTHQLQAQQVDNQLRQIQEMQKQTDEMQKQTETQEKTYEYLTDPTPPSVDVEGKAPSVGWLPAGPIDSLLLLPLNLMNVINRALGGTCQPVTATLPFVDEDLSFPCMSTHLYEGDMAPFGVILGGTAAAVMMYLYFKHLYKKVSRATSFNTSEEDEWGVL